MHLCKCLHIDVSTNICAFDLPNIIIDSSRPPRVQNGAVPVRIRHFELITDDSTPPACAGNNRAALRAEVKLAG